MPLTERPFRPRRPSALGEALSRITPERTIAVARECGVPTFVDAAAQRLEVPNRYLEIGADAVA